VTQIQHILVSEAENSPDRTTVNVRVTETFLADVDGA